MYDYSRHYSRLCAEIAYGLSMFKVGVIKSNDFLCGRLCVVVGAGFVYEVVIYEHQTEPLRVSVRDVEILGDL